MNTNLYATNDRPSGIRAGQRGVDEEPVRSVVDREKTGSVLERSAVQAQTGQLRAQRGEVSGIPGKAAGADQVVGGR